MSQDRIAQSPDQPSDNAPAKPAREPFPFARLFLSIGFAFVGSFACWITVLLGVLQFLTLAVTGKRNDDLRNFSHLMARYIQDIYDFVTLARDRQPFPLGPFPKE